MVRSWAVGILAMALMASPSAHADTILSITTIGSVTPSASCGPPPFFDCLLTATGMGVDAAGVLGPWTFSSPFMLFSADPVSATEFRNGGTFYYDDLTPANNDLFGTFTGVFNLATFSAVHTNTITGGTGIFAGASGVGTSSVQVNPADFTYVDIARFSIPLPSTLALLAMAFIAFASTARNRR